VSHVTHIRLAYVPKYVLNYKCSEEESFQRKATDRFPLDRKVAIMDFTKKNYDEAVAKIQNYLKELNSVMESEAYVKEAKASNIPVEAGYAKDASKHPALRLKSFHIYYGMMVQALLSDTLKPLEYGFEIARWEIEHVFSNEELIAETIQLSKELAKHLDLVAA
jgi:hypothetical protein